MSNTKPRVDGHAVMWITDVVERLMELGCAYELSISAKHFNAIFRAKWASTPKEYHKFLTVHKRLMVCDVVPHLALSATGCKRGSDTQLWKDIVPYFKAVRNKDTAPITSAAVLALMHSAAPLCVVVLLRYLLRDTPRKWYTIKNLTRIISAVPKGAYVACLMGNYIACSDNFKEISLTDSGREFLHRVEQLIIQKILDEQRRQKYEAAFGVISGEVFVAYFVSHQRHDSTRSLHDIRKYASFCSYDMLAEMNSDCIVTIHEDDADVRVSGGACLHSRLQFFQNALTLPDAAHDVIQLDGA